MTVPGSHGPSNAPTLIRRRPLEIEEVSLAGRKLRIPTLGEMLRIKAWLILRRNATRDYLDFAALAESLGPRAAGVALTIDDYYEDQLGAGGQRIAAQLAKQLADPLPYDLSAMDLSHYRSLSSRWQKWSNVAEVCAAVSRQMLEQISGEQD